jgi:hypothetical protein
MFALIFEGQLATQSGHQGSVCEAELGQARAGLLLKGRVD